MQQVELDPALNARIAGVTFGVVTLSGVQVRARDEKLWSEVDVLSKQLAEQYHMEGLGEQPRIADVRGLQKSFGFDPTRYRPSSEALLRRILKSQGLYQINTAVDINNWCSLEYLLPMCIYDLHHVVGQVRVRSGEPGEEYPGIGRQVYQIEGKVIFADEHGAMGSTVSDSERTKVTTDTNTILLAIYAPATLDARVVERYARVAGERMVAYNGGQASEALALTVPRM